MTLTGIILNLTIVFLPYGAEMGNSGLHCGVDAWGAYAEQVMTLPATAYVCEVDQYTDFYKWHEVGHHIWNTILTEEQKQKYIKAHTEAKKKWRIAFYRQYGMTDHEEDFCDNFASLVLKENVKPLVMKRRALIKKFLNF